MTMIWKKVSLHYLQGNLTAFKAEKGELITSVF